MTDSIIRGNKEVPSRGLYSARQSKEVDKVFFLEIIERDTKVRRRSMSIGMRKAGNPVMYERRGGCRERMWKRFVLEK